MLLISPVGNYIEMGGGGVMTGGERGQVILRYFLENKTKAQKVLKLFVCTQEKSLLTGRLQEAHQETVQCRDIIQHLKDDLSTEQQRLQRVLLY
jgi:hypothetical protein